MNLSIWLLFIAMVVPSSAYAEKILDVLVTDCYDGDTCFVDIPYLPPVFGERLGIRFLGLNTPEIRGDCPEEKELAKTARDFVWGLVFLAKRVDLYDIQRDKYFRLDAIVMADGVNVNQALIDAGLAVPYDGQGPRKDWCK